jgi:hypothetical protein
MFRRVEVYAFDADSANTTPLWTTSILNYSPAGATPVPGSVKRVTTTTGWTFGSNCCNDYSQGWVLSYNEATLQQEGAYTTEPGRTLASIWQKGAGISADSSGDIYVQTGEGFYAAGTNLSTSVIKLSQNGTALGLTD